MKPIEPVGMEVCSPNAERYYAEDGVCFSKESLIKLAESWNSRGTNLIKGINRKSKSQLVKELNNRLKDICGDKNSVCWEEELNKNKDEIIRRDLRPKMPKAWVVENPNSWLSNWDIQKVMSQYEDKPEFHYKFLGVVPINFEDTRDNGECISKEVCALYKNIPKLIKKDIQSLGLITNLDRDDEPGSHWTSLFICIDPRKKCFGAYYYDSVSRPPPQEITNFIKKFSTVLLKYLNSSKAPAELREALMKNEFRYKYGRTRHQYGNNECGVFSMVFQTRWIKLLERENNGGKSVTIEDVVDVKLTDEEMNKIYRRRLFSPNKVI